MKDSTKPIQYHGIGFLSLLCILFIALKLTGVIGWSWWWVLAPVWVPFVGIGLIMLGALALILLIRYFQKK